MTTTLIEKLEKRISKEVQDEYFKKYAKQARYKGNGVYFIPGTEMYSCSTRELFLMFCAAQKGIKFKNF